MELLNVKDILQKVTVDREKMIQENDKVLSEVFDIYLVVLVIVAVIFVHLLLRLFFLSFSADKTRFRPICF